MTFLKELRAYIDEKWENRMLLAEANQWPEDSSAYFGNGDECHMAFNFPLMPRLYMSMKMEDCFPDNRYYGPDAGDSRQLPVGHISPEP